MVRGIPEPGDIDWAEIERRRETKRKGFTTKQVFEHLLALTQDEAGRSVLQNKIEILTERDAPGVPE
jgi:hypothetical protein